MEGLIRQAAVPLLQQQARGFASRAAGGSHVALLLALVCVCKRKFTLVAAARPGFGGAVGQLALA